MKNEQQMKDLITQQKAKGVPLSEVAWQAACACTGWPYVFGAVGEECRPKKRSQYGTKFYKEHKTIITKCKAISWDAETDTAKITGDCTGCQWNLPVLMFDCRGFTRKLLQLVYGWTLQGSGCTSQWNTASNWKEKGEVADGIPQGVIVCLFYYKKNKNGTRTKTLEHTGFYFSGETCECSSNVQHKTTLDKKWEVWGIPACVDQEIPKPVPPETNPDPAPEPEPTPVPEKKPTLRRGSSGPYVTLLQKDLISLGYSVGKTGADGKFGKNTEAGVKAFQKEHRDLDGKKLKVDGIVGEKTWGALDHAMEEHGA